MAGRKDVVPDAVIVRKATGNARVVIAVTGQEVRYRDEFGEGECTVATMVSWSQRPTKTEAYQRRLARLEREQTKP